MLVQFSSNPNARSGQYVLLAVDLIHIPDADIGSEVVLWGTSSTGQVLAIDEVVASSGTVGYELMCAVTARVQFEIEH